MLRLTGRDRALIAKCAVCRWLTTGQLQRFYFPHASLNAVQKRLRKLARAGFLASVRDHRMAEALHTSGPKAKDVLASAGVAAPRADPPRQRDHLVGINDLRIAVETGPYPVSYFFAAWQLAALNWTHRVIPDAVFALDLDGHPVIAAEYDRSTENMGLLAEKIGAYNAGLPGLAVAAVLLVVDNPARLGRLARRIRAGAGRLMVLGTAALDLRGADIGAPIFRDVFSRRDAVPEPLGSLVSQPVPAASPLVRSI